MLHAVPFHPQTVDRFNNLLVTAFVTPGNVRFLLLHDGRSDENIKLFFTEVYELYVKVCNQGRELAAREAVDQMLHPEPESGASPPVWLSLAQVMLNPFHGPATKITNKVFDQKVKISARKYLA